MLVWLLSAAFAADPGAQVSWKGADATLLVRAPDGEHVAADAPYDLSVRLGARRLVVSGLGDDLVRGVRLGDARGTDVDGTLSLSVCEDGGSRCRMLSVRLSGAVGDGRKGVVTLAVGAPESAASDEGFPARVDASLTWEHAVARAKELGRPVLLDFGAVWCPPCQLMDVQVLGADPRPSVVDAFVIARLDVDDPSSWPLKDRYDVGGYPTVVAVEADGTELGRMVGYRGVEPMVAWLDAVATGRYVRHSDDPTPDQAADLAWIAVQEGRDDAAEALLPIAAAQPERVSYRLARVSLHPSVDDAVWLAAHAPGRAIEWVGETADLTDTPRGREAVRTAIGNDLAGATPGDAADLLYLAAKLSDDPIEASTLYGAAAALVRGQLTGDPRVDKAQYDFLALLTELSGHGDEAVAVLTEARDAFPDEPTFHLDLARLQTRLEHPAEALAAAQAAERVAWGDNLLMAGKLTVQALIALGRGDEAREHAAEILAAVPVPAEGVDVRTRRYRADLEKLAATGAPASGR